MFSDRLTGTPVGTLRLWATPEGLRRIDFQSGAKVVGPGEQLSREEPPAHLPAAVTALRGYFAGERREFDIPLDMSRVTRFQRSVYERLLEIAFGHVVSYGEVALELNLDMTAARAVGQAVGANPLPILVPCHRVVGADGQISGYGGGLDRKVALLRLEGLEVDGATPTSRVHPEVIRLPL